MIISVINYKGGVGKSTVAQNMAVGFKLQGYRVSLIDADDTEATQEWINRRDGAEISPSVPCATLTNAKSFTQQVRAHYENTDVLIIDCPPSLSPLSVRAMYLSALLIVPVIPTAGSDVLVTAKFLDRFQEYREMKEAQGEPVTVEVHLLMNMVRSNLIIHSIGTDMVSELAQKYKISILETVLHQRVAYVEASATGNSVLEGGDKKAISEIRALVDEVTRLATTTTV